MDRVTSTHGPTGTPSRDERGVALLMVVILLLMMSALGIHALGRAQDEATVAAASRRHMRTLMAADAGVKLALAQLSASSGISTNTDPIDYPSLIASSASLATSIRTGTLSDTGPQPIRFLQYVPTSRGGDQLNLGSGNGGGGQLAVYRVDIVARDAGGGAVQVQAQVAIDAPAVGY